MHRLQYHYILFVTLLASEMVSGQTFTWQDHAPFTTDSLTAYRIPYQDAGDRGRDCTWDFSVLPEKNETVYFDSYLKPSYMETNPAQNNDTSLFFTHREHTNYNYHKDTLGVSLLGYQTSSHIVRLTEPMPIIRYPFAYGDSIACHFNGTGEYNHLRTFRIDGTSKTKYDAIGRLLLPDFQTDSAMRIHTHRHYTESLHRETEFVVDDYQWYVSQCRYPLLESVKILTIRHGDTVTFAKSYYIPQELEEDKGGTRITEETEAESGTDNEAERIFTNATYLPNPVFADLHISYTLTCDADVYFSIHYNGGIVMHTTPRHNQQAGIYEETINMQGYPTGTYVLYVHVNDMIISEPIIKI